MEIRNSFEVPLPPADAWKVLMDIQRIAPCMPGAELLEVIDPQAYKGKVSVKLGPVALAFVGTAQFEDVDEANHSARVKAQGTDSKGRGGAHALVTFRLAPVATGTRVDVHTNLNLTGSVAQYGRGAGIIQNVAAQLIGQFADSLRAMLAQHQPAAAKPSIAADGETTNAATPGSVPPPATATAPPHAPAKPVAGFSLVTRALWDSLVGMFRGSRQSQ